ncbi:MAG: serine racemase VanT catalytic subunit, partial [Lachnospiraceae bacterium]|nr:serine racemase VanT catalytic subunit [Lachnospiraceae bacterium]
KCKLMAVVKTRAYGHGAVQISSHLNKIGIGAFAVATIDEGIELRKHGIRGEILILGYTSIYRASELKKYDLMQTLIDFDYALALNEQNVVIKTHIKIDTGMHRLGIDYSDFFKIKQIFAMKNMVVCGIYTHLCCSNSLEPDDARYTRKQIRCFYDMIDALKNSNIAVPKIHIQSTYGLLNYPDLACDYIRAGIALYGVLSSPNKKTNLKLDLRPVLSLKTRVVFIRQVRKGDIVGYDRKYKADRDSRIAILSIGYGDGFPRNLSCQNGKVCLHGRYAPIVGQICMDQLAVDVTKVNHVSPGDVAILIGTDNNTQISAPVVSDCSDSISNELLCRMGERLPVVIT